MRAWWVLLICSACAGDDGSRPLWNSGDRMHARVVVGDDGFEWLAGWHDTELNVDCPRTRSPIDACGATHATFIGYADATCTNVVVNVTGYAPLAWIREGAQIAGYQLDSKTPYTGAYYQRTALGCAATTAVPNTEQYLAHATDTVEIATSAPVAHTEYRAWTVEQRTWLDGGFELAVGGSMPATETLADGATRLRAIVAQSDNLVVPYSIRDTLRDEECAPFQVGSTMRCLPRLPSGSGTFDYSIFDDSQCTHSVDALAWPNGNALVVSDHVVYPTSTLLIGDYYQLVYNEPSPPTCMPVLKAYAGRRAEFSEFAELTETK